MKSGVYIFFSLLVTIFLGCNSEPDYSKEYVIPGESIVVHLKVPFELDDTVYFQAVGLTHFPRDRNFSEVQSISASGEYFAIYKSDRYSQSFVRINELYMVVADPGDTIQIVLEKNEVGITPQFIGTHQIENQFYLAKKNKFGYTDIRGPINKRINSKINYSNLKDIIDSMTQTEIQFLDSFHSKTNLPQKFIDFERSQIEYMGAYFKTSFPLSNQTFNYFKDTLPDDYFDFHENLKINNPEALLSYSYFWFLSSYFDKDLPMEEYFDHSGKVRLSIIHSHILQKSKNELQGSVKDIYHRYLLTTVLPFYSDSLVIDSLAIAYQVRDYDMLKDLSPQAKINKPENRLVKGDTVRNFYFTDSSDSLLSLRQFSDKIVYINIWATWCGPCIKNFPEVNQFIADYEYESEIHFINLCHNSPKNNWLSIIEEHNLGGINLFAEGDWEKKLQSEFGIRGIPHYVILGKGNVLYENYTDQIPAVKVTLDELLSEL